MDFNMRQDLRTIKTLQSSRVQNSEIARLLDLRIKAVRREIARLQLFAGKKPGKVADACNELAREIRVELES